MHVRQFTQAFAGQLNQCRKIRFTIANGFCGMFPDFASGHFRSRIYRLIGMDVDKGAFIMSNIRLVGGRRNHMTNLHVADKVRIATGVVLNTDDHIWLHRNVTVGPHVKIYTTTHALGPGSNRCDPETDYLPVVIEEGSWIGLGAIILPGVTIGRGSVVAAGSVVTADVEPNSLVQGVPATVVQKLPFGNR